MMRACGGPVWVDHDHDAWRRGGSVIELRNLNPQLGIDAERRESPIFHMHEQSGRTDQRVLGHATVQW